MSWKEAIREQRRQKEEYFARNPRSPLPPDQRDTFDGLSHYPVDEDYRFEVELDRFEDPDIVTVGTSTGGEQDYLEWGEFTFEVDGEEVFLRAYKGKPDEERLWVPFRDETSGEETYGAGRYLDLEEETHKTVNGTWILDLNEAYNPTCAYSDRYECPLPPTENWLDVPIEAGEKAYK